jgi:plastocyanin
LELGAKRNFCNLSAVSGVKCNEINGKPLKNKRHAAQKQATGVLVPNEKTLNSVAVSRSERTSKIADAQTEFDNLQACFLNMRTLVLLGMLVLISASLQGDLAPETPVEQAQDPQTVVVSVDSTNLRFSPSSISVVEGDTVRFFWSGQALPHNAVENDGLFDSGDPAREVDYSFTFERGTNGTYEFVCEPHASAGMVGTITVEPAPALEPEPVEPVSEDTPFASMSLTAGSMALAYIASGRRHGNG